MPSAVVKSPLETIGVGERVRYKFDRFETVISVSIPISRSLVLD